MVWATPIRKLNRSNGVFVRSNSIERVWLFSSMDRKIDDQTIWMHCRNLILVPWMLERLDAQREIDTRL